jgi:formamidopyrimidine-DNA glycosylase
MPELPEVETTKLGLEPLIVNQTVERAYLQITIKITYYNSQLYNNGEINV